MHLLILLQDHSSEAWFNKTFLHKAEEPYPFAEIRRHWNRPFLLQNTIYLAFGWNVSHSILRKKERLVPTPKKEVKTKKQRHRDWIIIVSNLNSTWYFTEYQNLFYTATVKSSHKPTTQEKPANAALAKIIFQEKVKSSVSFSLSASQASASLTLGVQRSTATHAACKRSISTGIDSNPLNVQGAQYGKIKAMSYRSRQVMQAVVRGSRSLLPKASIPKKRVFHLELGNVRSKMNELPFPSSNLL